MLRLPINGESGRPVWTGPSATFASSDRYLPVAFNPANIVDGRGDVFPKDSPSHTAFHDYSRLPRIRSDDGDAFSPRGFCFASSGHTECWRRPVMALLTTVQAFTSRGMYE